MNAIFPWLSAAAFYVAATPVVAGQAIRISLADLLLPFLALLAFIIDRRWRALPNHLRHTAGPWIVWAGIATTWMAVSLFIGRAALGEWSPWALQNKYLGWFALLFFLVAGYLFATAITDFIPRFLAALIVIGWVFSLATLFVFAAPTFLPLPQGILEADARPTGLMANSNAFGFVVAIVAILHLTGHVQLCASPWLRIPILASVLLTLVLTESTASLLAFAAAAMFAASKGRFDWRTFGLATIIALAAFILLMLQYPEVNYAYASTIAYYIFGDLDFNQLDLPHTAKRLLQLQQAIALWWDSPLWGIGLGSYIPHGQTIGIPTIHNSYLWLLVETGIPGLALVSGFFVVLFIRTYKKMRTDSIAFAGTLILSTFATFALFHEALYQRHVWFLAGLLLSHLTSASNFFDLAAKESTKVSAAAPDEGN